MKLNFFANRYWFSLALILLLFALPLSAEEKSRLPELMQCDDDLSQPLLDPEHAQWFTIPYTIGYPPMISNDMNLSAYEWNAFETEWINMRALAMAAGDWSQFYQDDAGISQVGDLSRYNRFDMRGLRLGAGGTINFEQP